MSHFTPRDVRVDWGLAPLSWEEALAQCPDATFFHTGAWLRAMGQAFGVGCVPIRFVLPDGRWALLPLTVRRLAKGLLPFATAGETGAYSGLVAPAPLSEAEAALCYRAVLARYPDLVVTGSPFAHGPHMPHPADGERVEQHTHLLELAPYEALRQGFSRGCKARGNKARRHGLEVRRSRAPEDARAFYQLYLDSTRRWGDKLTWARPLAFFEDLLREGQPHVQLFVATDRDRPIAGLLMAEYGPVVHYVAGATHAEFLERCPSNLLMEEAMRHYHGAGLRRFDFGPSNGLEGVIRFKESFGARPAPFLAQRHQSTQGQLYFALRGARDRAAALAGRAQEAVHFRRPAETPRPAPTAI